MSNKITRLSQNELHPISFMSNFWGAVHFLVAPNDYKRPLKQHGQIHYSMQ